MYVTPHQGPLKRIERGSSKHKMSVDDSAFLGFEMTLGFPYSTYIVQFNELKRS
jgi:hypothetical protein